MLLLAGLSVASAADVEIWHAYRGAEKDGLDRAVAVWSEQTGHAVVAQALPFGAFQSKAETAIPRGNGPDLIIAAHDALGKWTAMGLLEPWDGPTEGFREPTVAAMTWEDQVWGLPLAFKSVVLLYDPTLVDTPPETTDALLAAAERLATGGRYGLAYQAAEPYFHAPWMHAFGGRALEPDGTAHLDAPEQVRALDFVARIAGPGGVVPQQPTGELVGRLYREGNVAFVISGPWFVADQERPIAAAPLPIVSETGERARPYLTVDGVMLTRNADAAEPARELMAWLAGPEGAAIRMAEGGQAVAAEAVPMTDPLLQVLAEQAAYAVPMPADPAMASVFEAQARGLRGLLRGSRTPEGAAREAQSYFEVVSRPPPPPASPLPYALFMVLALLGLGAWAGQDLADPAFRRRIREHRGDYLWILPAGLALSVLVVLPFLTGAAVSLFAHHGGEWSFVGFAHFLDILLARDWPITSPLSFGYTLGVTVLWTVSNITLHVALGVALALVLREPWIRLRAVWRVLLIIPWAVPNYITALIWKGMFHAQYGAINALLGVATGRGEPVPVDWFGSFATAFAANLATNTWLGFPFMMVITLGALQSIPRDLEEAAEVDGASWWFRFRHVVWPLLRPALLPAVILGSVWTFNMFNVIYLVSGGEPDGSTEILISEAYRWAFSRGNHYGYASAYAVLIFGVLVLYSRAANRLVGRRVL